MQKQLAGISIWLLLCFSAFSQERASIHGSFIQKTGTGADSDAANPGSPWSLFRESNGGKEFLLYWKSPMNFSFGREYIIEGIFAFKDLTKRWTLKDCQRMVHIAWPDLSKPELNRMGQEIETSINQYPNKPVLLVNAIHTPSHHEPIKVSGSFQESNLIKRVEPVYPEEAKQARINGPVDLTIKVDEDGNVSEIKVAAGHPLLRDAAVNAVKQWKYRPAILNDEAVSVLANVTVIFLK